MTQDRLLAIVALAGVFVLTGMRILEPAAVVTLLVGLGLKNPLAKP